MKAVLITAVAAAGLTIPSEPPGAGRGGWKDLDGEQAPVPEAEVWLNALGDDTTESLSGNVYLLEFFATW